MRSIAGALWALFLVVALAACGGGGGGSDGGAALTFSPATVTANVASGTSATITVRATATDTSLFSGTVYVYIVDSAHVLTSSVELTSVDSRTVSATIHTLPTLAAGRYQGTFQIHLCNDASCASQVRGSPVPLPYDLTITPAPLHAAANGSTAASVHHGGDVANPVTVLVSGSDLVWTATTEATWLQVIGGAGTGAGSFSVKYVPQALAEGSYSGTVTVRSNDGQTVTLPFTLDVLPTQFVLNSGVPTFNAVNGAPIASQAVTFALNNDVPSPWTATSSASWMLADPLAGATPAVVTLQPDPTRGPLASGSYSADLLLSSPGIANKTVTSQLTLTKPTLSASAITVTLGGAKGRDLTSAKSVSLSLNTGANSWPYAISALPAWLSSTTPSGSVNQTGTALSMAPNSANVTPGSTSANVSVTATVNGDTVVLPLTVNLNADQRRLLSSEWGVGLASTPTGTALSRTLTISDNFSGTLAWTASSDAAWLAVTSSGTTGGTSSLVLTADPSALTTDSVSYANVTVSASTSGVEPAIIRVALWKSASGLAATTKLALNYSNIVADKTRPYVYANNGGTTVDVFNAYTAQQIGTVTGVGSALGHMSVSLDGAHLYALDTATRSMAVVDLATMAKTANWSLDNAVNASTSVLAMRPNGVEVVLVGDGTAYTGGRSLGTTQILGQLVGTADGKGVYTLGASYSVDYSAMSGGVVFVSRLNFLQSNSGGNLRDVAVNKDGTHVYQASGGGVSNGGYRCASIDGVTGTYIGALPGGDAYPNNVEVTIDGRPICGISGWYSTSDFWVHSPSGALLQGYKIAGYARALKDGQMVVTPDGFVVVALTDDPLIAFVPIGP